MKRLLVPALLSVCCLCAKAQVGEHRSDLSVGFNGGYVMSSINFVPTVSQVQHGGFTGGLSFRYICEKYFTTVCSLYGEVNFSQIGWKEDILDRLDQPVINPTSGLKEEFQRTVNYVQVPIMAHLAWGRERKGFNFFFQAGPQFGVYLNESVKTNFDIEKRNGRIPAHDSGLPAPNMNDRVNPVVEQDSMSVEKKFDYGIAGGLGVEFSHPKIGHFLLEGRYYYGLGNIYGNTKKDFFSRSNYSNIVIKLTYLFDLVRTKNDKIK